MGHIPVIDITGLGKRPQAVADEIRAAMALSGFFQVSGHGIPPALIADIRATARGFFAAPAETKSAIAINQNNRGYLGEGMSRMRGADHVDLKEVFFWGRELGEDDPEVQAGLALCGPNLWPEFPENFRDVVTAYHDAIERLGNDLLSAIALSLGAEAEFFQRHYLRSMTRGQLIHYPPVKSGVPANQFGVAPHSDFGCITLLLQETPGLEVLTLTGEWLAVPPLGDTLVVNIGDLLERWSNGRYPSTRHRVRNSSGSGRYSIAMFHDPSPDALVDAADLNAGVASRFPPVTASEHILGRNKEAFAHYKAG